MAVLSPHQLLNAMWAWRIYLVLVAASIPFLLESSLELYVLTLAFGPQMVFFSISHTGSAYLLYGLMLSGAFLAMSTVFGLVCIVARFLGALRPPFPSCLLH